ncbi:hypothetical protein [Kingella potus]|uniref:hypothetical protein n=1 Tax=Kingella potus TaxID=265175 RepID=UPI001FD044A3|nr:hypothetical protein [Kingella potus]UOO99921.1 hypothetical protein LVJ84_07565 [Kingella potus]
MNCWQILNIAPTNDERAVKRAYAGLLKTTRPDDDAAAYQRLRQAFEDALAAAPYVGADEEDGDAWMFDEWDEAEETAYPDEAEQAQRPSENGEAFENAAYGFSDGHASELCTADEFIARLHHIHRLADGRGLLKLWPQLAAQLAALNEEEERARAAAHLAEWLERPHGLPKKLQTLWRKECRMAGLDIRPSENETGGSGNSVSDGFDTQYQAIAAQLEAWYEAGGLSMLMRRRRQTFAFFNAFAPEECERLEQETFRFLLRHQLADSPLRQHWREYFRRRAAGQSSVSPEYGAQAGAAGFAQATQYLHEYGGNGGFDAGGDPLAFAERCYAVGGSNALAQSWPTLHEILDGLPLGAAQELSPQFADFLRLRNIIHPLLWLQWADYFHWDEDVHGRIITPAETQQLTHYRRLARLTGGDGGADLAGFPVSDGLAATPSPHDAEGGTESPRYTRAFDRFLGSSPGFWRRFRAVCAVMVVWPELSGETDEDERAALAVFRPALARLLEWGGEWRGAWLIVMVSAFLTFGVWGYSVGESEPAGIQLLFAGLAAAAVALAASAAYMLGLGALFYVPLLRLPFRQMVGGEIQRESRARLSVYPAGPLCRPAAVFRTLRRRHARRVSPLLRPCGRLDVLFPLFQRQKRQKRQYQLDTGQSAAYRPRLMDCQNRWRTTRPSRLHPLV